MNPMAVLFCRLGRGDATRWLGDRCAAVSRGAPRVRGAECHGAYLLFDTGIHACDPFDSGRRPKSVSQRYGRNVTCAICRQLKTQGADCARSTITVRTTRIAARVSEELGKAGPVAAHRFGALHARAARGPRFQAVGVASTMRGSTCSTSLARLASAVSDPARWLNSACWNNPSMRA